MGDEMDIQMVYLMDELMVDGMDYEKVYLMAELMVQRVAD